MAQHSVVADQFGTVSSEFWQQIHLDMANLMAEAGLAPYLQFGEVQWWYFATVRKGQAWHASSGMPLYDDYTKSNFQAIYGRPLGLITSQNAPPASFLEECAFLPTLIDQFTDSIINFVCQTQPSTRFEVLYPPDVNDAPLNQLINLPRVSWTTAKLNCLKTENFTYAGDRDLDKVRTSIELPLSLGFTNSQASHLVGIWRLHDALG